MNDYTKTTELFTRDPACSARVLTTGTRAKRAVILLHGLTGCSQQMTRLGKLFHSAGYNVYIPCLPLHGLADKRTDALTRLTPDSLRRFAAQAVEDARPLGGQLCVFGFSTGGLLAAWLALECPGLKRIMAAAPAFGLAGLPPAAHPAFLRLMARLPNRYIWWDPIRKDRSQFISPCGYPGFPLQALRAVLELGQEVYRRALSEPVLAEVALFVLNESEPAVNNHIARQVATAWNRTRPGSSQVKTLSRRLRLRHDYFYGEEKNSSTALTSLVQWMNEDEPT